MTMNTVSNVVDIRSIKRRLWNPIGGRHSSELEIIPAAQARRNRDDTREEKRRAKQDFERKQAFDAVLLAAKQQRERSTEEIAQALAALESIEPDLPKVPKIRDIIECVADFYLVSVDEILSQRRQARIVRPRHIAMYLAHKLTRNSYPEIGRRFEDRDHTTILSAVRKVTWLVGKYPDLAAEIADLKSRLEVK